MSAVCRTTIGWALQGTVSFHSYCFSIYDPSGFFVSFLPLPPPSSIRYQSRTPNAISIIFLLINLNHTRLPIIRGDGDPGFDTDVQLDTLELHFPFRMINFPPIRAGGHGSDSFLVCRQTKPVYCFNLSSSNGKTKQSLCHNAVVDDDGDGNEVC